MSKYNVSMEAEINVSFSNPEKAKSFFVDGQWHEHFWKITDLEDLAKNIAQAFHQTPEFFDKNVGAIARSPEGFGRFVKQQGGKYLAKWDEFGEILVTYESELEAVSAYEV